SPEKTLPYFYMKLSGWRLNKTIFFSQGLYCDHGYLLYGNYCYHFEIEDMKNWQEAEDYCVRDQGHLVSIYSEEQLSFLNAHMPGAAWVATSDVWTGLNDLVISGMFTWSDEHMVTFTHWAPGEPNNHQGFSEDCVEMFYQVRRTANSHAHTDTLCFALLKTTDNPEAVLFSVHQEVYSNTHDTLCKWIGSWKKGIFCPKCGVFFEMDHNCVLYSAADR
uniref:C-type lectin domain-containing protein n=1 Tax=Myripristis murdjan TaxID=586833 RepID=A0A667X804_9TELE